MNESNKKLPPVLRYRGYYYDTETGFYYLQSRYYDPVTHRFINADSYASTGQGVLGYNMFAYCLNNPVMFVDYNGKDVEVTIFTVTFEFDVSNGTVEVTYSLKRTVAENSEVRILYEPGTLEYEFAGGPLSAVVTSTLDGLEADFSLTFAEMENEYGSVSAAISFGGLSITTQRKLSRGYFEEIIIGYKYKKDWSQSLQPAPVYDVYDNRQAYGTNGALEKVGTIGVSAIALSLAFWALFGASSNKAPAGSSAFSIKP